MADVTLLELLDPDGPALKPAERRRMFRTSKDPLPAGHVKPPGSGPKGETCKTCQHCFANRLAKTYYKCGLNRANWTGGRKTDIRLSDPACSEWSDTPAV